MLRHFIAEPAGAQAKVFADKDRASTGANLGNGDEVEVVDHANATAAWSRIRYQLNPLAPLEEGWLPVEFLGERIDGDIPVPAVTERDFTRQCVGVEVELTTGGDDGSTSGGPGGPSAALAEYLLALAMLESDLTSFDAQFNDSDGVGPYQISSARWNEFLAAQEEDNPFHVRSRYLALNQIWAAAYLSQKDMTEFAALAQPDATVAPPPSGPFLPSFLNIFHAWLFGVEAAHKLFTINSAKSANPTVDAVLKNFIPDDDARGRLLNHRKRYTKDGGTVRSVQSFFDRSAAILTKAMRDATTLLRQHAPEAMAAQDAANSSGAAPWMAFVDSEHALWEVNGLEESSGQGLARVNSYFTNVSYDNEGRADPWCGAFAASAIKSVGDAVADTVIPGAARAANWKGWGDVELRHTTLISGTNGIPRGAVIVLSPAPGTNASGHVCFFDRYAPGDKDTLLCIGGNQNNRVKQSDYKASRVVAIRWLGSANSAALVTGDAQLTLARTLFGEARGDGGIGAPEGRRAVANVIMNRVASSRYANDVEKVCLQPKQFSCWNANDPNRLVILAEDQTSSDPIFQQCLGIAAEAISNSLADQTGGALHYHSKSMRTKPSWVTNSPNAVVTARIGAHIFYTGIK